MITYEVKEIAQQDLEEIKLYYRHNHILPSFEKLKTKFYNLFDSFCIFSRMGEPVQLEGWQDFHYTIVEPYYIFYSYNETKVYIERILHTKQLVSEIAKNTV